MPRLKPEDLFTDSAPADFAVPQTQSPQTARQIIDREKAARDAKISRLREQRLAREAAEPPATTGKGRTVKAIPVEKLVSRHDA